MELLPQEAPTRRGNFPAGRVRALPNSPGVSYCVDGHAQIRRSTAVDTLDPLRKGDWGGKEIAWRKHPMI